MSSNIPLIQPKEYQIKDVIGNLKTDEQKASDSAKNTRLKHTRFLLMRVKR